MHEEVIMLAFQASRVICWVTAGRGLISLAALTAALLVGRLKGDFDYAPVALIVYQAFWASLWLWFTWGIVV